MKQLIWFFFLVSTIAFAQSSVVNTQLTSPLTQSACGSSTPLVSPGLTGISVGTGNNGQNVTAVLASGQSSGTGSGTTSACSATLVVGQTQVGSGLIVGTNGLVTGATIGNLMPAAACSTSGGAATPAGTFNYMCLYNNSGNLIGQVTYTYNTAPMNLTGISLAAGNTQVTVNIADPNANTAGYTPTYEVCFGTDPGLINGIATTTNSCPGSQTGSSTSIVVQNLTNGTTYYFTARVQGSANTWTASQSATPIETDGFGETYAKQGGTSNPFSFSCAQTSTGPATWVLFLLLALFLKRRSKNSLAIFLLVSVPAFADLGQVNFSVIGAPYLPALDQSTKPDGSQIAGFYGNMFYGNLLPLMGIETDFHLLDDFGSLQLGFGLAYAYASGNALSLQNNRTADSTGLHMLHLRPQLTYALDTWVDTVPLVPYVRGGIVTMGYLFTYQGGIDKEQGGANPMGFMFGWEAAGGLMLALDWMEPSVSKAARANGAYDHIYLKAEIAYMPINNFGRNGLEFFTCLAHAKYSSLAHFWTRL